MNTHNIYFYGERVLIRIAYRMFLWRNKQNYPQIILKYHPYLFHCQHSSFDEICGPCKKRIQKRLLRTKNQDTAHWLHHMLNNENNIPILKLASVFIVFAGTILKGKEEAFAKSLHELAKEPVFNCMNFESLINDIRTHVAEVSSCEFYMACH